MTLTILATLTSFPDKDCLAPPRIGSTENYLDPVMSAPKITVLMPVYNGEKYLRPAIESVLGQTYADFELLIIDDGSTDSSLAICREYTDPRIRLASNERNLGLIETLNRGMKLARGEYLARMDCDDISLPRRFERQFQFMESNPGVGICGTWFERVFPGGSETVKMPADDKLIRYFLLFDTVFGHNTVFLRRSVLETHGLRYDPAYRYAEDYEFWVRCSRYTRLANIPEVHVHYRFHSENTSNRFREEQSQTADRVRRMQLEALGMAFDDEQLATHCALLKFKFRGDYGCLERAGAWLVRIGELAAEKWEIAPSVVNRELGRYWYAACGSLADQGMKVWRLFMSLPIGRQAEREWRLKLLWRCLARSPIKQG